MVKTVVIYGMVRKTSGRMEGAYADVDFAYTVDNSISADDVVYFINSYNGRPAVVPARTDGSKLSFAVGIDNERRQPGKPLNRVGLSRAIARDLSRIDWNTPTRRRR